MSALFYSPKLISDLTPKTIDDDLLYTTNYHKACNNLLLYVLSTHISLTPKNIKYTCNIISQFYQSKQISLDDILLFLVYTNQNTICKFALTFNEQVILAITTQNSGLLLDLLLQPKTKFIELYDNAFLSAEQYSTILRQVNLELECARKVFDLINQNIITIDLSANTCINQSNDISINKTPEYTYMTNIISNCYKDVCLIDSKVANDNIQAIFLDQSRSQDMIYVVDKPETLINKQLYCFDILTLIKGLCNTPPINPETNQPFNSYTTINLFKKYPLEIAMYKRFKQEKDIY